MVFRVILSGHSFRPWATALAIGLLAAMVGTQPDVTLWGQPAAMAALTCVRQALGWTWTAYVVLLVGRAAVAFVQRRARLDTPGSLVSALRVAVRQSKVTQGPLPLSQVVDRAVLVTGLTFPRFLHDLPSGTAMAFWLVVLLTCGYLALDGVLAPHRQWWYWWGAAIAVALWGIGKPIPSLAIVGIAVELWALFNFLSIP